MPWYMIFLLIVAAIIGLVIFSNRLAARKRSDEMARLAARPGYDFRERVDSHIAGGLRSTHLFRRDMGRTVQNLVLGKRDGAEVRLFDYATEACTGPRNPNEMRPPDRSVVRC